MSSAGREGRAGLPSMTRLLEAEDVAALIDRDGRDAVVAALRSALDAARTSVGDGGPPRDESGLVADATAALAQDRSRGVRRVINATGIVLHTNLGRAPLSQAARDAVAQAAGPSTVEFDLAEGRRGSRTAYAGELAARICGTSAATVVNNGAAALVLAVAALASGREVIVSRGELVEIGGSFRLPDIIRVSGARLVEVGTTNRTHIDDYRDAIGPDTGMLLSVHRSNFRQVGFVADVPTVELAVLAAESGVPLVHDLGSGLIEVGTGGTDGGGDALAAVLDDEPVIARSVAAGSSLVLFSGDKLLAGPQAGIIAGRTDLVERCRRHPLARITRIDKLQLAALEATLRAHLRGTATTELPALTLLRTDLTSLNARAERIAAAFTSSDIVASVTLEVRATETYVGGGSAPGRTLPGAALACSGVDPELLAAHLRDQHPPVIARIEDGVVLLDLRSVPAEDDATLSGALRAAIGAATGTDASRMPG